MKICDLGYSIACPLVESCLFRFLLHRGDVFLQERQKGQALVGIKHKPDARDLNMLLTQLFARGITPLLRKKKTHRPDATQNDIDNSKQENGKSMVT